MSETCSNLVNELGIFGETIKNTIDNKTEAIKNEAIAEANKLNDENPQGNTGLTFNFDVTWTDKPIKFHLPTITIVDKQISLDLPTVKMVDKDIKFNLPVCNMEDQVVGRYPEFHGLRVEWHDIITTVPVCENNEQRIVIGIPEISMQRQDMIIGIPNIEMREVEIAIKYPEFKLVNVAVEMKEKSEKLESGTKEKLRSSFNEIKSNLLEEFRAKHTSLFDCLRSELLSKKNETLVSIDGIITGLNTATAQMKEKNVPSDNDSLKQTEATLQDLVSKRSTIDSQFEQNLNELNAQQQTSLEKFVQQFDLNIE
ncbi:hypothetical protein [Lysinibacillus sp. NPDC056220]|uniref:hypothetical protein n=1 Tax=Lysinibacillus sp. NPDC056220 TaxID=3398580 RepID=UPI003BF4B8B2